MYTDKIGARHLVEICIAKGMEEVVIAPGSRNAPLTLTFARHSGIKTTVLVDERSAAFYALGIAQRTRKPVGIVCSSGTAGLNFAPALAEAFYQRIPLVAITADRPVEWVDQADGQTIRQNGMFGDHVRKSVQLPQEIWQDDEIWHHDRLVCEAIDHSLYPVSGPVHINIPFREPLYDTQETVNSKPKVIETLHPTQLLNGQQKKELADELASCKKVMVLGGLGSQQPELTILLEKFAEHPNVVLLTETTSNLPVASAVDRIDQVLATILESEEANFAPDLLITFGGAVVSKKIKQFLRRNQPAVHWHVDLDALHLDTYQHLTRNIPVGPEPFFRHMLEEFNAPSATDYRERWMQKKERGRDGHADYLADASYSDLWVFDKILAQLPNETILHSGNSSPVRYVQLFGNLEGVEQFSNRGTSGIDGMVSTAAGMASVTDKQVVLITGDLGFLYDSNALWNKQLPGNLKIIVINNGGGGIFRIIDGPSSTDELEEFFEAGQEVDIEALSRAYGMGHLLVEHPGSMEQQLSTFFSKPQEDPVILEIRTPKEQNAEILQGYFGHLKKAQKAKQV